MIFAFISIMMNETEKNKRIFVIDSGKSNLKGLLGHQGFEVRQENDKKEILKTGLLFTPHLIVGDFFEKDAEPLISSLRDHPILNNTPIILCTQKQNLSRMIQKINGNVNDYMVVPVAEQEINVKIERVLDRHENVLNSNPLSHLPGNITLKREFIKRSQADESFAIVYLDLDNFKAFNDHYGYSQGDDVIKFVAHLLRMKAMREDPLKISHFVGHVGGDDFVFFLPEERAESFCRELIEDFDEQILSFYSEEDRERQGILSTDRKGLPQTFPLMSISLAVVIHEKNQCLHFGEISALGSEIKHHLKNKLGSHFMINRRQGFSVSR